MQTFQDTTTGQLWAFEDGVTPSNYPSTPTTLSLTIVAKPADDYEWDAVNQAWNHVPVPAAPIVDIPAQIAAIEAQLAALKAQL